MEDKYGKEIQLLEEQRVVEMNMLDAELLNLRDERNQFIENCKCKNRITVDTEKYLNESNTYNIKVDINEEEIKLKKFMEEGEKERKLLGKLIK